MPWKGSLLAAGSILLAACGGQAAPASTPPASAPVSPASSSSAKPAASPAAAASAKSAASTSAAKPIASGLTPLHASFSNVAGVYIPWWLADDAGIFAQNGLAVDMKLMAGATTTAAMLGGDIEMGSIGGGDVISADASGADLVAIGVIVPTYTFIIEAAQSVKAPADLKGKGIGISTIGSASDIGTRVGLRKLGIDPKDVRIVQEGTPVNALAALKGGAIDAATISPPQNVELNRQGFHELVDLSKLGLPAATNTITVRKSWVDSHKDVTQKFIDSLVQATARAHKDRQATEQVIRKYLKYDDQDLINTTYDYYVGQVFPPIPDAKVEQFKDAQDELSAQNEKLKGFDVTKIFDSSFVQSAADRGLDKG